MRWMLTVVALAGCGRSGVYGATTLVSTADAGLSQAPGSCSRPCSAPEGALDSSTGTGVVLHWETCRGCIALTLDPRLQTTTAELDRAAQAWATATLCFKPARLDGQAPMPPSDPRIHLSALEKTGVDQPYFTSSTINYVQQSGAIINASALAALDYPLTPRHLVQLVGRGLGYAPTRGESVMNEYVEGPATLTAGDRQVHERLYGAPPACER